jgi:outer membrane protein assembly factor BamB
MGAESSAAMDREGNLYFGSHDGCFYSLTPLGNVRWMFKTDEKIYSSPVLTEDAVYFCGGDGFLYAFDHSGNRLWQYDICVGYRPKSMKAKAKAFVRNIPVTLDWSRKYFVTTKSWASPLLHPGGFLVVTGYGGHIHAVNQDGSSRWKYRLSKPQYSLAGVCGDSEGNIYGSELEGILLCLSADGDPRYTVKSPSKYRNWASPSHDTSHNQTYFPMSHWEKEGTLIAVSKDGRVRWSVNVAGGIRGTAVIANEEEVLLCALNGRLLWLRRTDGKLTREVKISKDSRALWTSPCIDAEGRVLITIKDSHDSGRIAAYDSGGQSLWEIEIGKALSTPVIDADGKIYVGSWDGYYRCFKS